MSSNKQKADELAEQIIANSNQESVKTELENKPSAEDKELLYDNIDSKIGPMSTPIACG